MKKIHVNFVFPLTAMVCLIFALSQQMFTVPPLGKLLDPFTGAVQNADKDGSPARLSLEEPELTDSVHVFFDDRDVPHIYAKDQEDLYFAQGYVTASLRLWQMDFLSYVSAGRLSEIFKEGFLNYDRNQRRIGMLRSAAAALELIEKDPETLRALTAYTKGVNAYIRKLDDKSMPLEYKLLDYKPEPWTNLKTALIMKYMANTLSGYEMDHNMSGLMLTLGSETFNKLFPAYHAPMAPVVNDSGMAVNPALVVTKKPDYLDYSFFSTSGAVPAEVYNPKLGSNSWVVSGKKTTTGYPILCNDPHLNLSLPSIWMEMQLSSPDENVYGVSIPGTPAVIIGFNRDIAWGITNGEDDVKDWYKLKITSDYKKYELDGQWHDLEYSIEKIGRRGQSPLYDTIYRSIHGPIVIDKSFSWGRTELRNYALRWEMHRPSNEFLTFIKLNKAHNYNEYREAIKSYSCPSQNFTFACRDNTISVDHQGKMAVKWPGQGKFLLDGTRSDHLYTSYIPEDSLPHVLDPACNYVFSANQHPTNAHYPYYYNGYYSENRANRISRILEKENGFDIQRMEAMQLDDTSSFAMDALPLLMGMIEKGVLNDKERKTLDGLRGWKGDYGMEVTSAELFELWWKKVRDYTWDEFKQMAFSAQLPDDYVLLDLIAKAPADACFDRQATAAKETAKDVVTAAFRDACTDFGRLPSARWGTINKVSLMHLTNIRAFSDVDIPSAGQPETINAQSARWGPSWRMVVELGERPKAFGIYAGGQSGNVGSRHYDDFVSDWNKGKYYPLTFFMSEDEAKAQTKRSWILK